MAVNSRMEKHCATTRVRWEKFGKRGCKRGSISQDEPTPSFLHMLEIPVCSSSAKQNRKNWIRSNAAKLRRVLILAKEYTKFMFDDVIYLRKDLHLDRRISHVLNLQADQIKYTCVKLPNNVCMFLYINWACAESHIWGSNQSFPCCWHTNAAEGLCRADMMLLGINTGCRWRGLSSRV